MNILCLHRLAKGVAALLLLLSACHANTVEKAVGKAATKTAPEMFVVTGLKGTVAPCGCTSHPLGGIAKLAKLIGDEKKREPMLVSSGDFLFESTPHNAAEKAQAEARATLIEDVFAELSPSAQLGGDNGRGRKGAWISAPRVLENNGLKIEFVPLGTAPQGKADVVVALTNLSWDEARRPTSEASGVDIVIDGGGEKARYQHAGKAWLLDAGDRGQRVLKLEFHNFSEPGAWQMFDHGAADKALVERQLTARV